jgi:hypothetical protein
MFGTQLAEQNDTRFMSVHSFALSLVVELTKQKRVKVPELFHYACNPDLSQMATNKKECETVILATLLEVWGCSLIKCRNCCLEVQKIF